MGSPYFVHKQVNRTHVVRTSTGFERILNVVSRSMGRELFSILKDASSPELVVLNDLLEAYNSSRASRSRSVVFLEARYEWTGWDKFQRVIVFDFSGKGAKKSMAISFTDDGSMIFSPDLQDVGSATLPDWELVPYVFNDFEEA